MPDDEQGQLVANDPESEACFNELQKVIAWELGARIAIGDDPRTPGGLEALSELVADAVLDRFTVRARGERRYPWSER
jgi:hypothetical protein